MERPKKIQGGVTACQCYNQCNQAAKLAMSAIQKLMLAAVQENPAGTIVCMALKTIPCSLVAP